MGFIENLVGVLAVAITVVAYYQVDRLKFLKLNVFAVLFFGLTLFFNKGLAGAVISFVNVLVYLIAIVSDEKFLRRAAYLLPPLAFVISFWFYSTQASEAAIAIPVVSEYLSFIPAVATFLVSLSALQHSILRNKLLLFSGVSLWGFYSFLVTAWYAVAADVLGLVTIAVSLYRLRHVSAP